MGALKIKVGGEYITVRRGPRGPSGALTGEVKVWPVAAAPSGYLSCDGSAVSRTVYADLFAAIGTVHGVGDGSTTFNLPDYRGRVLIGAATGLALGAKDSIAEASRAASFSHAHNHTATSSSSSSTSVAVAGAYTGVYTGYRDVNHNHTGSSGHPEVANTPTSGGQNRVTQGGHDSVSLAVQSINHNHDMGDPTHGHAGSTASTTTTTTTTVNTNNTALAGSQDKHPYAAVNYIIKT